MPREHPASLIKGDNRLGLDIPGKCRANGLFERRPRVLRFATVVHHWTTTAAATSSTQKIGNSTGGTNHSRRLKVGSSDI